MPGSLPKPEQAHLRVRWLHSAHVPPHVPLFQPFAVLVLKLNIAIGPSTPGRPFLPSSIWCLQVRLSPTADTGSGDAAGRRRALARHLASLRLPAGATDCHISGGKVCVIGNYRPGAPAIRVPLPVVAGEAYHARILRLPVDAGVR